MIACCIVVEVVASAAPLFLCTHVHLKQWEKVWVSWLAFLCFWWVVPPSQWQMELRMFLIFLPRWGTCCRLKCFYPTPWEPRFYPQKVRRWCWQFAVPQLWATARRKEDLGTGILARKRWLNWDKPCRSILLIVKSTHLCGKMFLILKIFAHFLGIKRC